MLKVTAAVSERINLLRFPMALAVVWIHANDLEFHFQGGRSVTAAMPPVELGFIHWISEVLARIAVPMFFVISGFLLFSTPKVDWATYWEKLGRRVHSLLIPFLVWNSVMVAVYLLGHAIPWTRPFFKQPLVDFGNFRIEPVLNAIFGYRGEPLDVPLWFVRDLLLLVILSPALRWAIGFAPLPVFLLLGSRFFGFLSSPLPILGPESTLYFCIGLWFGKIGLPADPKLAIRRTALALWLFGTLYEAATEPTGAAGMVIHYANISLGVAAVWWLTLDVIAHRSSTRALLRWAPDSFFLFASHGLVINIVRKLIFSGVSTPSGTVAFLLIYGVTPVVTVLICVGANRFLNRFAPPIAIALGGMPRPQPVRRMSEPAVQLAVLIPPAPGEPAVTGQ
jgi:fucose 4-O-acetylase-like acetyltransferase